MSVYRTSQRPPEIRTEVQSGPSAHVCPRCKVQLFYGTKRGVTVHACGACGGAFLDATQVGVLYEASEASGVAAELGEMASVAASVAATHRPALRDRIACPICAREMNRERLTNGLTIDRCVGHGIWFDAGELRRAVRDRSFVDELTYASPGELSPCAKRVVQEREIHEDDEVGVLLLQIVAAVVDASIDSTREPGTGPTPRARPRT